MAGLVHRIYLHAALYAAGSGVRRSAPARTRAWQVAAFSLEFPLRTLRNFLAAFAVKSFSPQSAQMDRKGCKEDTGHCYREKSRTQKKSTAFTSMTWPRITMVPVVM